MKNLIFFGNALGKFIDDFITINNMLFIKNDINIYRYLDYDSFMESFNHNKININLKTFIVLIYCEDVELSNRYEKHKRNHSNVIQFQNEIPKHFKDFEVLHGTDIGEIIGNKIKTNKMFSENGILCPTIVSNFEDNMPVFQNEVSDSGRNIKLVESKSDFDRTKYNTEFINSIYNYDGENYYTSIRFLCVGEIICSSMVRFRNTKENNPSVHTKNTPLDANLINSYYIDYIKPRIKNFELLCYKIYVILGLGFYAHDFILSQNGDIYLLETMFKAHDRTWFEHIKPITNKLFIDNDSKVVFKRIGKALIKKI